MILIVVVLALAVIISLFFTAREKDPAKLIAIRQKSPNMIPFERLEEIYQEPELPSWKQVANELVTSGSGIKHTLRDAYCWVEISHALVRDCTITNDPDIELTKARIRSEFLYIVKMYWVAKIEFLIGKTIPVQYVYGRSVLKHYFDLTNLVDKLCYKTHPDLKPILEKIT